MFYREGGVKLTKIGLSSIPGKLLFDLFSTIDKIEI